VQKKHELIDAEDSVLVVIDVQDKFLTRLDQTDAERVVAYCAWLMKVANWLSIPIVVTAEEISVMGNTTGTLLDCAGEDAVEYDKMVFGLAGQPDILAAMDKTGRRTAVLVGLETDVCVAQSALGLLEHGYKVAVVADACSSPQAATNIASAKVHAFFIQVLRTDRR